MRHWLKTFFVLAALLILSALPAAAQMNSAVRGSLGGIVFDATGSVLPNADVTITGPQGEYKVKTDSMGRYLVQDLVPGNYTVKVEVNGFKTYVSQKNLISANASSSLDVHLQVGAVSDTVTVEAGAVQIDTESTALTTPLTDQLYQSLPLPRNVSGIFALAAGVVSGGGTDTTGNPTTNPSIGGASGLENLYLVDGVNVTDQAFGGFGTYNRQLGALGTGVNLAFIKEVDIKTTAFEPSVRQGRRRHRRDRHQVRFDGLSRRNRSLCRARIACTRHVTRSACSDIQRLPSLATMRLPNTTSPAEFGGYVPGFKNKMFFFGAFDPAVSQEIEQAQPGTPLNPNGNYNFSLNERSWAGKITYQPLDQHAD